jgi:hypothetical protein
MARSSTSHTINAARFRLGRVRKDWGEIAALLRQAAAQPDYAGPDLKVIERIEGDIAAVKLAIRDWVLNMALQDIPARRLHDREAILQEISVAARR